LLAQAALLISDQPQRTVTTVRRLLVSNAGSIDRRLAAFGGSESGTQQRHGGLQSLRLYHHCPTAEDWSGTLKWKRRSRRGHTPRRSTENKRVGRTTAPNGTWYGSELGKVGKWPQHGPISNGKLRATDWSCHYSEPRKSLRTPYARHSLSHFRSQREDHLGTKQTGFDKSSRHNTSRQLFSLLAQTRLRQEQNRSDGTRQETRQGNERRDKEPRDERPRPASEWTLRQQRTEPRRADGQKQCKERDGTAARERVFSGGQREDRSRRDGMQVCV
jgi:hypothetical protein